VKEIDKWREGRVRKPAWPSNPAMYSTENVEFDNCQTIPFSLDYTSGVVINDQSDSSVKIPSVKRVS
jgi:hypothetical protein